MKKITYIGIMIAVGLAACKPTPYVPTQRVASDFNLCIIERHGNFYDQLTTDVMSIDLYSEGLSLDSLEYMHGTGTNLFLSDVFVPTGANTLPDGIYYADSLGSEMTFLPGRDFEGQPNGTYILLVAEGKVGTITLCTDSTMQVSHTGDTLDLQFRLRKTDGRMYKAHYRGIPIYKQKNG